MNSANLLFAARERIRMSLWFIPGMAVASAVLLAIGAVALDRQIGAQSTVPLLFRGGPESARNLLSTIAGAMITSIALIFSVTIVVLQLASAQYSPRVLRSFIRDRVVQGVLAVYIATFVYCLIVLPSVTARDGDVAQFVPAVSVSLALLLALVSVAWFVRYIDHIAQSIRAVTVLRKIGDETRSALDRMYPDEIGEDVPLERAVPAPIPSDIIDSMERGVLVAVDEDGLLSLTCEYDLVVRVIPLMGSFVPCGSPLLATSRRVTSDQRRRLLSCIALGDERTIHQDPGFGFRQIVDVAERALSPGVNDPTTAVQAIDQLHDLLRTIARRRFPEPTRADDAGQLRVIAPRFGWDEYVNLAFDEIRHYSGHSIQVARRLRGASEDLLTVAPPQRRAVLRHQIDLVDAATEREFPDSVDRAAARRGTQVS